MPSPLFLLAVSFFAIIAMGGLLVAVNDWLEARLATPEVAGGPRRSGRPLFARAQRRWVRSAIRLNRQEGRLKRPDLIADWF